jgi:hypothetical protein
VGPRRHPLSFHTGEDRETDVPDARTAGDVDFQFDFGGKAVTPENSETAVEREIGKRGGFVTPAGPAVSATTTTEYGEWNIEKSVNLDFAPTQKVCTSLELTTTTTTMTTNLFWCIEPTDLFMPVVLVKAMSSAWLLSSMEMRAMLVWCASESVKFFVEKVVFSSLVKACTKVGVT